MATRAASTRSARLTVTGALYVTNTTSKPLLWRRLPVAGLVVARYTGINGTDSSSPSTTAYVLTPLAGWGGGSPQKGCPSPRQS